MQNWIPQLHRPKNEILTYVMAVVALVPLIIPVLTSADFSTPDGITAAVVAVATLIARRFSIGLETHAEMSAEPAGEGEADG